jgi:hypothetical protein
MHEKIWKLCSSLQETKKTGTPIEMETAMVALTIDIISEFSYGKSYGFLDKPGFDPSFPKIILGMSQASMFFRYFAFLVRVMLSLPDGVVAILNPGALRIAELKKVRLRILTASMACASSPKGPGSADPDCYGQ